MSNINKYELRPWTWKSNISLMVIIVMLTSINLVLWFNGFGDTSLLTKIVLTTFTILYGWWISDIFRERYPSKKKFNQLRDEREKIIEEDIIGSIALSRFNPKINGSEDVLRNDVKTVLAKLAEEY